MISTESIVSLLCSSACKTSFERQFPILFSHFSTKSEKNYSQVPNCMGGKAPIFRFFSYPFPLITTPSPPLPQFMNFSLKVNPHPHFILPPPPPL